MHNLAINLNQPWRKSMKIKLILAVALTIAASQAIASPHEENSSPISSADAHSTAQAAAFAGSISSASVQVSPSDIGNNASQKVTVEGDDNDYKAAASSAISPNVVTNIICPILTQNTKAVSAIVFSASGTTTMSLNAICVAYHLGVLSENWADNVGYNVRRNSA